MQLIRELGGRFGIAGELLMFFWRQMLWCMIPMVTLLLGLGLLFFFASASGVGPFIYTLF